MDILANLNPQQRLAVEHGRGPALVLAGAGSGKTRVITFRIAYLIRNASARPENILAVTFTNKAAQEMRERVQHILGSTRTAEPLISTFHSFCVRLLRKEIHHLGFKRDFSIYDTDDQKRLIKQILDENKEIELELSPREILSRISYAKNHGVPPELYAACFSADDAPGVQRIFTQYNDRLKNANSLDFDDLLLKTVELLGKMPELRKYYSRWYSYILVDEYQDTNRPQYELLRLLTDEHRNLFVVGDEDQSIYRFRGADIQNILRFEKDFPGARIIKLEQNYRSSRNILRAAGAVVEHNTERKGKNLWTENPTGDVITCRRLESAREEAEWISDQIRNILADNPDERIAVLYRANFLSRNLEEVLTEAGTSYVIVGSVAFFGRMEVKDMLAYVRLVFNPEDDAALLRIINIPPRGIGSGTVHMLTRTAAEKGIPILQAAREKSRDSQLPARTSRALLRFLELIDKWTELQPEVSISQLLEIILRDVDYRHMLEKQETAPEVENRFANIQELIRAAAESEQRGETIAEFLDRASLSSELDHLDPNARVSLMTLHSAKGLEFDTVFLAGMEEGLFPHHQSIGSMEDLEEERRLCYVGITRAKRKLYLSWTPFRKSYGIDAGFPAQASRFIDEMPRDLIEMLESEDAGCIDRKPRHYDRIFEEPAGKHWRIPGYQPETAKPDKEPEGLPKSIAELKTYLEEKQRSGKTDNRITQGGPPLKVGTRVRHEQFGDGIVLSRERSGNEIKLTVTFSRVGKKLLIERYAKLKAL